MMASVYGHHDIVRTLLEAEGNVNDKTNVRNQLMMMRRTRRRIEMIVDNDDRRSMY